MTRRLALFATAAFLAGCKTSKPASTPATPATQTRIAPVVAAPPFKLFHQTKDSLTLVTDEHATDDQIVAILFQLRNAAHAHSFEALHLPQKFIDARDPIVWFHLYRGEKCASEKYTPAKLPCGASYHAAGDYTLGSFANKDRDEGVLFKDDHQTQLWNPDTT